MHGCEVLFDEATAKQVRAQVKKALGVDQCPCEAGRCCPLLPPNLSGLLIAEKELLERVRRETTER